MEQHHQFSVQMSCSGCSNAVERALKKVAGVNKVETNLEKQTVDVYGEVDKATAFKAIEKTGKTVSEIGK